MDHTVVISNCYMIQVFLVTTLMNHHCMIGIANERGQSEQLYFVKKHFTTSKWLVTCKITSYPPPSPHRQDALLLAQTLHRELVRPFAKNVYFHPVNSIGERWLFIDFLHMAWIDFSRYKTSCCMLDLVVAVGELVLVAGNSLGTKQSLPKQRLHE